MEPVIDNNNSSDQSSFCRDEKVEAMDLLEERWFFENLLNIRSIIMPRSYSDPYPSSSSSATALINTDFLVKDNDVSSNSSSSSVSSSRSNNNKPPRNGSCCSHHPKKLQRAPSMPQFKVREVDEEDDEKKQGRSKLVRQPSDPGNNNKGKMMMKGNHRSEGNNNNRRKNMLVRTPSLPTSMGRDEKFQENDPRIGRSHKQPSTTKSCSIPRYRPCKNIEGEGIKEMRPKYLNQRKMRRSLSDLELEEVQGFKDLGFSFEKDRLSPSLVSIIPGLQDKNRDETEEDKKARGPYLSEAWLVKSPSPPPPPPPPPPPISNCDSKKSAADMKEHIKFWARAVASNVHQEC
ncbi:hypothetical protein PIB30_068721 [Stylosanthes scabra]|uniref:Uncharacterized protein n=1 Tax=Stylosanthes scabra TaxID=79078 RepID=A0ABU6XLW3_9FABA|nr:hypothetical protein [Stylosanthes scabra]